MNAHLVRTTTSSKVESASAAATSFLIASNVKVKLLATLAS